MKVLMLRSKLGSNDGTTTKLYLEGEEYDVSDALGACFLEEKVAKPAGDEQPAPVAYVEGQLYTAADGEVFIGAVPANGTEVALLPVAQLADEEREALVAEGKLTVEGTAPDSLPLAEVKAVPEAPKNKAVRKAPKNKAA